MFAQNVTLSSSKLIEQHLRLLQIARIEPTGEVSLDPLRWVSSILVRGPEGAPGKRRLRAKLRSHLL